MDLSPVLARLKSQLTGFVLVGSAADLDAVGNGVVAAPSCFLLKLSESAEDSQLLGVVDQRLTVGFSVIVVSANLRDATGAAAVAGLEALRAQIRTALLGWVPDPAVGEPVRFSSGALLRFDDAKLWWADEFRVTTYLRSV